MKRGRQAKQKKASRQRGRGGSAVAPRFWGHHAVEAALANPEREVRKLLGTRNALSELEIPEQLPVQYCELTDLALLVPPDAPHQGVVAEVAPLEDIGLPECLDRADGKPLVILDQVTDPRNIGAIFRSALAFGAGAIITQDRHAPPESGVIAKAASGALDRLPWVRVVNLSRALEEMADAGYWRVALTGHGEKAYADAVGTGPVALVLGAEGEGLRPNVAAHCDIEAYLPIEEAMESLNVSNAAAIALYVLSTREK
ncbi:23S rRNA (guanosine(2251)-2'-O)-methyltransferase RlmB [Alterisphingorhabdus coralli]|uniref:23S rRNA (Guanosine(2251)-2'-O)-methyltransferase RlmB n=1 Tax=Alterisphingorhabdus coralli TaxID=3071408 RepID=A0AA97F8C3_9SPHN|nr:23S rRNA (guanosine(2251)-2'-O)-methyltransferase RlmB [Parasphingorhabdus sp. SCSIO 66989]WOE76304.1 23S rRNA (guanosine(2251)-2'-O)-methyltransferase RlmB [Parasphingorhabdus sp. SCSIO 66989]